MCKRCVDVLAETFPNVPDREAGDFLMSVTAFPFGSADLIASQLRELRAQTNDYRKCYGIVEREMDRLSKLGEPDCEEKETAP